MSTQNYKYKNVLITLPDFNLYHECDAGDEVEGCPVDCEKAGEFIEFDDFAYECYVKDVQDQLEKIGFKSCEKWESGRDGGKIIAKYGMYDTDGMIKWLEVVVRSGYYDGANIDYIIDGDFGIEDENNKKQIKHYEAMNRKFDALVKKTEKVLRKNGTELTRVGVFSNGEAIYKIKK